MKFLCDVHISHKLVKLLNSLGFAAIHVNELLDKWYTTDSEICRHADENNYVVVTKDSDFRDGFFVHRSPKKLIKINLGNISNKELLKIFREHIEFIAKQDSNSFFLLEIDKQTISITKLEE